jgi:hypothetical protein
MAFSPRRFSSFHRLAAGRFASLRGPWIYQDFFSVFAVFAETFAGAGAGVGLTLPGASNSRQ